MLARPGATIGSIAGSESSIALEEPGPDGVSPGDEGDGTLLAAMK
jgi:hypothetical protein